MPDFASLLLMFFI